VPPPWHVRDLSDYWLWLDELIDSSGGYLDTSILIVEPVSGGADDSEAFESLIVPAQYVRFFNGTALQFALTVDSDLALLKYSFHYMHRDGLMVWRKDNVHRHRGHPDRAHIHLDPKRPKVARPYREVDPDDAFDEVMQYIADGTLPVADH
jgi:Family of unknown function (DUF6516)